MFDTASPYFTWIAVVDLPARTGIGHDRADLARQRVDHRCGDAIKEHLRAGEGSRDRIVRHLQSDNRRRPHVRPEESHDLPGRHRIGVIVRALVTRLITGAGAPGASCVIV